MTGRLNDHASDAAAEVKKKLRLDRGFAMLQRKAEGWSDQRIADEFGCSRPHVALLIREYNTEIGPEDAAVAFQWRQVQNEQARRLISTYLPMAESGDYKAAELVLKTMNRVAAINQSDLTPTVNVNAQIDVVLTPQERELHELVAQVEARNRMIEGELASPSDKP